MTTGAPEPDFCAFGLGEFLKIWFSVPELVMRFKTHVVCSKTSNNQKVLIEWNFRGKN